MTTPENRLQEIEIKLTFLERHVGEQDRVILKLREQIDLLSRQLERVTHQLAQAREAAGDDQPEPPPPHY